MKAASMRAREQKYHASILLLGQSAEADGAKDLATVLETGASAISLGVMPALAARCIRLWSDCVQPAARARGRREPSVLPGAHRARSARVSEVCR